MLAKVYRKFIISFLVLFVVAVALMFVMDTAQLSLAGGNQREIPILATYTPTATSTPGWWQQSIVTPTPKK